MPGEGKTLTAANVALTLSESFRNNVIIIDADLRRPSLHDVFQVPNLPGLSDWLKRGAAVKVKLVKLSPVLTFLTAGRPNPDPMSMLTSGRMRRLLADASERFDWVIIDTPPIGLLSDANLLGAMVDRAVLVVSAGRTPHELVRRAADTLGRDRIVGVLLNRVEDRAVNAGYGYDYYYTGYGYGTKK